MKRIVISLAVISLFKTIPHYAMEVIPSPAVLKDIPKKAVEIQKLSPIERNQLRRRVENLHTIIDCKEEKDSKLTNLREAIIIEDKLQTDKSDSEITKQQKKDYAKLKKICGDKVKAKNILLGIADDYSDDEKEIKPTDYEKFKQKRSRILANQMTIQSLDQNIQLKRQEKSNVDKEIFTLMGMVETLKSKSADLTVDIDTITAEEDQYKDVNAILNIKRLRIKNKIEQEIKDYEKEINQLKEQVKAGETKAKMFEQDNIDKRFAIQKDIESKNARINELEKVQNLNAEILQKMNKRLEDETNKSWGLTSYLNPLTWLTASR